MLKREQMYDLFFVVFHCIFLAWIIIPLSLVRVLLVRQTVVLEDKQGPFVISFDDVFHEACRCSRKFYIYHGKGIRQ